MKKQGINIFPKHYNGIDIVLNHVPVIEKVVTRGMPHKKKKKLDD